MMLCTCCGQWKVAEIVLNDRHLLRVYGHGYAVATVPTVADAVKVLRQHGVRLQDLVEVQP